MSEKKKEVQKKEYIDYNKIELSLDMNTNEGRITVHYPQIATINGQRVRIPRATLDILTQIFNEIPELEFTIDSDDDKDEYILHLKGNAIALNETATILFMQNSDIGNTPLEVMFNAGTLSDLTIKTLWEKIRMKMEENGGDIDGDYAYR